MMRAVWKWIGTIGCLLHMLLSTGTVSALTPNSQQGTPPRSPDTHRHVWVLSVPGLSFLDVSEVLDADYPHLRMLFTQGMSAGMNVRTPERGVEDVYLALGAGRGAYSPATYQFEQAATSPPSREIAYAFHTGERRKGQIFLPEIEKVKRLQQRGAHDGVPGALGEELAKQGIQVRVYGNRDRGKGADAAMLRHAPYLLMDHSGQVEEGTIHQGTNIQHPNRAYGMQTHYAWLQEQLGELADIRDSSVQASSAVTLVELGDLDRLLSSKELLSLDVYRDQYVRVLRDLDRMVAFAIARLSATDTLLLFSPLPQGEAVVQKYLLAPIVVYPGSFDSDSDSPPTGGWLTSLTTKRTGIVSYADFAPTLLKLLGVESQSEQGGWIGHPMTQIASEDAIFQLTDWMREAAEVYRLRPRLLIPFVTYEVLMLIVLILIWLVKPGKRRLSVATFISYTLLAAPVAMLWSGYVGSGGVVGMSLFFLLACLLLSVICMRFRGLYGIAIMTTITVYAILIDGLTGANGMQHSVLGYDPMIGARYYGIGNELMGVLIGAALMSALMWIQISRISGTGKPWTRLHGVLLGLLVWGYLASPMLGTNAGGAITTSAAVVYVLLYGGKRRLRLQWRRSVVAGSLFAGLVVVGFILWLLNLPLLTGGETGQSHIGKAMRQLEQGNWTYVSHLVLRKLQMNMHLVSVSMWTKVWVVTICLLPVLLLHPKGLLQRWQQQYPYLIAACTAISISAVAAFIVNDSGIVAASTMIVFAVVPLFIVHFQELSASQSA
ncbi:hypothetical protein [Marinicrinis sediminis]|uniref:Uncharacterized protein n=1 Tax=Marinicrinis sediminis TaxID=1652465 RepID=A0ABW5R8C1_9BACL